MNTKSKYTRDDRKNIVKSIENLKDDTDYVIIFDILMSDTANDIICTTNSNGVFLNLSVVGDDTLDKINVYLDKISKSKQKSVIVDDIVNAIPNTNSFKSDRTYKLSNYEQNIIRQRDLKKVLEKDNEYEELSLSKTVHKRSKTKNNTKTPLKRNIKSNVSC